MTNSTKVTLLLLLLSPALLASGADLLTKPQTEVDFDKMIGTYFCVTDRMAGIQHADKGEPIAGQISPNEDTQKFTLNITKVTHPVTEKTQKPWYAQCREYGNSSKFWEWMSCDARYNAEFSKGFLHMGFMRGDTPNHFLGTTEGEFYLYNDMTFRLMQLDFGSLYVAEGRCSRFETK